MSLAKNESMSIDELNHISENLVDTFRKSFCDCLESLINQNCVDGHNQEITQFKGKHDLELVTVVLQPGFVVQSASSLKQIFINICYNDFVQLPSKDFCEAYEKNLKWSLSYLLSHIRPFGDKLSENFVCDIVFNTEISKINNIYQYEIALKCIENHYNILLDIQNTKILDLQYVGNIETNPLTNYVQNCIISKGNCNKYKHLNERLLIINDLPCVKEQHCIKHRYSLSIHELYNHNCALFSTITIQLPYIQTISFDITEKVILLLSQSIYDYNVNILLPHAPTKKCLSAQNNNNHNLILTLPADINKFNIALNSILLLQDDSGIDSDTGSPEHCHNKKNNNLNEKYLNESIKKFYEADVSYKIPGFNVSMSDNVIMFAFNIKNIKSESLTFIYFNNYLCLKCSSELSEINPSHYAFAIKLHFGITDIHTDIWDNAVTLQFMIKKKSCSLATIDNREVNRTYDHCGKTSSYENKLNFNNTSLNKSVTKNTSEQDKIRSISESSEDNAFLVKRSASTKGILKYPISNSADNHYRYSLPSDDFNSSFEFASSYVDSCEENNSTEAINKKSVRFKDAVIKQVFRSNSSILGQKKKNQRKNRNKKRAHDRRMSESENSECEDKETTANFNYHKLQIGNKCEELSNEVKNITLDNSKCAVSKSSSNDLIFSIDI